MGKQKYYKQVIAHKLKLPNLDRKSTRLNSSHSQISYAVFCLKKKKNNVASRLYSSTGIRPTGSVTDAGYAESSAHAVLQCRVVLAVSVQQFHIALCRISPCQQ